MTYAQNNASAGVNGATVTTADGGGTPWSLVTIGAGATCTYDTSTAPFPGGVSIHYTSGATARQIETKWDGLGNLATVWMRADCFFAAFPVNAHRLIGTASGAAIINGAVKVLTTGQLQSVDSNNNAIKTSVTKIPLNRWFRIECFITGSASAGQIEYKIFNDPTVATPAEVQTSSTVLNTQGLNDQARFGDQSGSGVANMNFRLTNFAASSTGYIGPAYVGSQALGRIRYAA